MGGLADLAAIYEDSDSGSGSDRPPTTHLVCFALPFIQSVADKSTSPQFFEDGRQDWLPNAGRAAYVRGPPWPSHSAT